jgi:hypothetical protein
MKTTKRNKHQVIAVAANKLELEWLKNTQDIHMAKLQGLTIWQTIDGYYFVVIA